ncbi:MAG: DfsB family protein [Bacteroidetes bacterium]|nr:MAG: DfsB family protein [Bacteroidota bacterium]
MPRPQSKVELRQQSQAQYQKLLAFVDGLSPELQQTDFPAGTLNRNIRDILAHLHHWHLMMLGWYETGMAGQKPAMPDPGYTWKDTPALNREIWARYHERPLPEIRTLFEQTHGQTHALIEAHSEAELFTKKHYPWTGSTSLAAYLISATASHYDWALKLMRKMHRQGWGT